MINKRKLLKIAFTGHRPNKLGGYDNKKNKFRWFNYVLHKTLCKFNSFEIEFISGMALGVDQWAAFYAIDNRIPLHAYVPFVGQESRWPKESRDSYHLYLSKATSVNYICKPGFDFWKMQRRNEAMVNDCSLLIAVWDGSSGGTANCVDYARKINKRIIILKPDLGKLNEYTKSKEK